MPEPVIGVFGVGRLGETIRRLATAEGHAVQVYDARRPEAWPALPAPDVIVDSSAAEAVPAAVELCRTLGVPLVECVSGLGSEQLRLLRELAESTAVVHAPNLSLGNYLQTRALRDIAGVVATMAGAGISGAVPEAVVLERHPATKAHRPSTTAVRLAREWLRHTGEEAADIASLRGGAPVSDHEVRLLWPEQTLTVTHTVGSLDAAAAGAIGAAGWAVGRPAGSYTLHEVFDDLLVTMVGGRGQAREGDR